MDVELYQNVEETVLRSHSWWVGNRRMKDVECSSFEVVMCGLLEKSPHFGGHGQPDRSGLEDLSREFVCLLLLGSDGEASPKRACFLGALGLAGVIVPTRPLVSHSRHPCPSSLLSFCHIPQ